MGGLTSPVKGPYTEPLYFADKPPDSLLPKHSSCGNEDEQEHKESVKKVITADRKTKKRSDDDEEKNTESKRDASFFPQTLVSEPHHKNKVTTVSELELLKLEQGGVLITVLLIVFSLKCSNSTHCFSACLQIST